MPVLFEMIDESSLINSVTSDLRTIVVVTYSPPVIKTVPPFFEAASIAALINGALSALAVSAP